MSGSIIVTLREGTEAPLFCFHLLNGLADPYDPFFRHLPDSIPIIGVELAPLDGSHRPHRSIPAMCADHADTIEAAYPDGPLRFLGYSWGGQIAHQTAVELSARGRTVEFLGLIDTWHPDDRRRSDRAKQLAVDLKVRREPGVSSIPARLRAKLGKIPKRAWYYLKLGVVAPLNLPHSDEMQRRRFVRIALKTRETHRLAPYAGVVTFFEVDSVDFAGPEDTAASWRRSDDATVVSIRGAHRGPRSAMTEPRVAETADAVLRQLRLAEGQR